MADMKKELEREELHRAIWAIADELRGAVDGWDFKNYVLGTMFYRYISENLCNYINSGEIEAGNIAVVVFAYALIAVCAIVYFAFLRDRDTGCNADEKVKR